MKVKYHGHKDRSEKAKKLWKEWAKRLSKGENPDEFRFEYINKNTGKPYSREHIYLAIRKVSN